jgi:Alpha-L-arabinofuranosidase B (ABFB) domain
MEGDGMSSWIQSNNFEDRYIRHRNFLAELDQHIVGQEADYEWDVKDIPGHAHRIRFRPPQHDPPAQPDLSRYALRHKNLRLVLEKPNGPNDEQWKRDSKFIRVKGLAGSGWSYQASNLFPAHFIRHRDFHLYVEPSDGSEQFHKDATFSETRGV